MHITNLRKVGGSVMLAVPPALLDVLHLKAGAQVGVTVKEGRLVIEATANAYRASVGQPLAERLLAAMQAGEQKKVF